MGIFSDLWVYSLINQTFRFSCPAFSTFHLLLCIHTNIHTFIHTRQSLLNVGDGIISTIPLSLHLLTDQ